MSNTNPSLPQPALPFPAKNDSYDGLTEEELLADLKQVWENICAWPKKPVEGWQGMMPDGQHSVAWAHDLTGYQLSGINIALKKVGNKQSQHDRLVALGLDPNGDKNSRH